MSKSLGIVPITRSGGRQTSFYDSLQQRAYLFLKCFFPVLLNFTSKKSYCVLMFLPLSQKPSLPDFPQVGIPFYSLKVAHNVIWVVHVIIRKEHSKEL